MVIAGQIGYGMNVGKMAKGEVYEQQMDNLGQAHLARQYTTNSELGFLKQQNQMIMQQMAQMCQQMNLATSKPPPPMNQMQFQPQQFQPQQFQQKYQM